MKDTIYWLLAIISVTLSLGGLALIILFVLNRDPYSTSAPVLPALAIIIGMIIGIYADRRGKRP